MDRDGDQGPLIARCVVCRGNIHQGEPHEVWEGCFYCRRHSLPYLRERAREYGARLREGQKESEPTV
ncbi:MAG: hypothetical protein ACRDFS_09535 [Chloroflexota bacterium]